MLHTGCVKWLKSFDKLLGGYIIIIGILKVCLRPVYVGVYCSTVNQLIFTDQFTEYWPCPITSSNVNGLLIVHKIVSDSVSYLFLIFCFQSIMLILVTSNDDSSDVHALSFLDLIFNSLVSLIYIILYYNI